MKGPLPAYRDCVSPVSSCFSDDTVASLMTEGTRTRTRARRHKFVIKGLLTKGRRSNIELWAKMKMYMRPSLPRALLNCTTSRKDPFSSSWGRFHQCSTAQTLRDLHHTTLYSQCTVTGKSYPIRTHFSLSVSPVRRISPPFNFLAICSHRHSLKRTNPHILSCSPLHQSRHYSGRSASNTSAVRYIIATTIVVLGLSYAAVPLYRMFCQASGYGGTVTKVDAGEKVEKMEPVRERSIVVR